MTEQEIINILQPMLLITNTRESWATKNYNSGWNQCLHHVARQLCGLHHTAKSPLETK
jgi:hypothetical protein